ncbi:MAG: ATP-binding protein [Candidatus Omnitrophota bacterium]
MSQVDLSELHKNILNEFLSRLKDLLRAESASLFIFDREREELVLNSVFSENKIQFRGLRQRLGEGIAGSVAHQRQAVLVKNINEDPRFQKGRFRHYQTDSFICLPIATRHGLVGVVNISDKTSGGAFSEEDFQVARLVAQTVALIIENQADLVKLKEENEDLKREQAERREEKVHLEKFASMGKLAGGVVHEINNPLDAVMRYTNILIEKNVEPSMAKEYLNEVKIGLTRITKITRSLLEFAQQLNDTQSQDTVDVHDMAEEALSLFRHALVMGQVKVERLYAKDLPKVIDKGLCRIFSNIIKNAMDAMPTGGVLKITTGIDRDHFVITFRDSGCGIPEEVREKMFTPFFTTKAIGKGVGLGLPICFEVVQRYDGKIEVESKPNEGSEFKIRLPLKNLGPQTGVC